MSRKICNGFSTLTLCTLILMMVFSMPILARDKLPETSPEGLKLQDDIGSEHTEYPGNPMNHMA